MEFLPLFSLAPSLPTSAGSIGTSLAIASGNTLESLVGAYLINRWSDGCSTFDTPSGVIRFALICFIPSTIISATLGVGSLSLAGYADWSDFRSIWTTWCMGDLAGVARSVLAARASSAAVQVFGLRLRSGVKPAIGLKALRLTVGLKFRSIRARALARVLSDSWMPRRAGATEDARFFHQQANWCYQLAAACGRARYCSR
jgi:hypothetical protein